MALRVYGSRFTNLMLATGVGWRIARTSDLLGPDSALRTAHAEQRRRQLQPG
jgi:hypothetical protein